MSKETPEPKPWSDWYRFAREELGLEHAEGVEYANLRYVEERNRASLRARAGEHVSPHPRPAG